jgi:hypothetical protein
LTHFEEFELVAFNDVVVITDRKTTFVAFLNLTYIILEALKRVDVSSMCELSITENTYLETTLGIALVDIDTGNLASTRELKHLADDAMSSDVLFEDWWKEVEHRFLDCIDQLIDDLVVSDSNVFLLRLTLDRACRSDIEADNETVLVICLAVG